MIPMIASQDLPRGASLRLEKVFDSGVACTYCYPARTLDGWLHGRLRTQRWLWEGYGRNTARNQVISSRYRVSVRRTVHYLLSISLVGLSEVTATSLLFVGGSLILTLLLRRRSRRQAVLGGGDPQTAAPFGMPVVTAPPTASTLPTTPPVTVDDFAQSLRELRRNLSRAEASIQRSLSERVFSNRPRELAF